MSKQKKTKKPGAVKNTAPGKNKKQSKSKRKNKNSNKKVKEAKEGQFWSVNDKRTRGHKSLIVSLNKSDRKKENFKHLPITHAPKTRKIKNIKLNDNPEKGKSETSYMLRKVQKSKLNDRVLGKRYDNVKIKNPIDKSVVRKLKKKSNRKKKTKKINRMLDECQGKPLLSCLYNILYAVFNKLSTNKMSIIFKNYRRK